MESPDKTLLRILAEPDQANAEPRNGSRPAFSPAQSLDDDLWRDVFVERKLPWGRFLQSAVLHTASLGLIWTLSMAWMRQQKILDHAAFDRSSLVTYSPQEYLPPLDTGAAKAPKTQNGDRAFARQPILYVPGEQDNRSQTIVVPPDLKLDRDVALPNIVATAAIVPAVPLDATRASASLSLRRIVTTESQVVAPPPEVQMAPGRVVKAAMKSEVIAPPPEVNSHATRALAGSETTVVEPPPELKESAKSRVGPMNIGPREVVAPAPQLTLAEQHSRTARGSGHLAGGVQAVAPAPSVAAAASAGARSRLIALGIHPVAPSGPVLAPEGNRRAAFEATPQGSPGASGTPDLKGSKAGATGSGTHGSLPAGLHVGAANSKADDARAAASLSSGANGDGRTRPATTGARAANAVSDDKITDVDRQVFGGKRFYAMTLNMPNLNSATGSWVIRFAELQEGRKDGDLLAPVPTEKSDPGYPLELMRANVHGMVTLYAVIQSDGRVGGIRVLNSPDERLDAYAEQALERWKFLPAERAGKPVALEAVVMIPFRVKRSF